MNSGIGGTEAGKGDDGDMTGPEERDFGGRVDVIGDTEDKNVDTDDTGGGDVDMNDETGGREVGEADKIDDGGRVDMIGDMDDVDVDVDDSMDDETLTRGWDGVLRIGSVDAIDAGRGTAGMRGGSDCSMSLLFTPGNSSSSSSRTCRSRVESRPASKIPETSALAFARAGKASLTAAFLAKYSSLRDM